MTSSEKRAKKAAAAIAQIRSLGQAFNSKELVELLKRAKCPYASYLPKILLAAEVVTKDKKIYSFVSPEPVYFGILKRRLDEIANSTAENTKNAPSTHDREMYGKNSPEVKINSMIRTLKDLGYKIYKPTTEYTEV